MNRSQKIIANEFLRSVFQTYLNEVLLDLCFIDSTIYNDVSVEEFTNKVNQAMEGKAKFIIVDDKAPIQAQMLDDTLTIADTITTIYNVVLSLRKPNGDDTKKIK